MLRRRIVIGSFTLLLTILFSTALYVVWIYTVEVPRIMSDFAALWNTTDALTSYIHNEEQWPGEWDDLRYVAPLYDEEDLLFARDQIDVNFGIDISELPNDDEWCVRVKSGRIEPEQQNANKRIRASIIALQKRSQAMVEAED